jgi:hypothetical protein
MFIHQCDRPGFTFTKQQKSLQLPKFDMIRFDIYILQLGLHSVAVDGKLVHKYNRDSYILKRNSTQNNTKAQNTQNRKQVYTKRKQT